MDLRVIASTFAVVFLAELADKTQLATFGLAAANASKWSVFLGSALALVASSALAVVVGGALSRVVPPSVLMRVAGVLLVVLGVFAFVSAGRLGGSFEGDEGARPAVQDTPDSPA